MVVKIMVPRWVLNIIRDPNWNHNFDNQPYGILVCMRSFDLLSIASMVVTAVSSVGPSYGPLVSSGGSLFHGPLFDLWYSICGNLPYLVFGLFV